jgi:triosephosphate isomerase
MILVNFKNYESGWGEGAIKIAGICKRVSRDSKVEIYPVVSALDTYRIMKEVGVEVILQAVGEEWEGPSTGQISAIAAQRMGVKGSLINHSELKMRPGMVKKLLKIWPKDFWSIVCIHSVGQAEGWAKNIKADWVAYEPSSLIGSKDKSVASEKPEAIRKIVNHYQPKPVLVGAGVHSLEDVKTSISLGARGILVSSDIIKAVDPEKELRELVQGFVI